MNNWICGKCASAYDDIPEHHWSCPKRRLEVEVELLDKIALACGRIVPDACVDTRGQLYGISSAKEIVVGMLKTRLDELAKLNRNREKP